MEYYLQCLALDIRISTCSYTHSTLIHFILHHTRVIIHYIIPSQSHQWNKLLQSSWCDQRNDHGSPHMTQEQQLVMMKTDDDTNYAGALVSSVTITTTNRMLYYLTTSQLTICMCIYCKWGKIHWAKLSCFSQFSGVPRNFSLNVSASLNNEYLYALLMAKAT